MTQIVTGVAQDQAVVATAPTQEEAEAATDDHKTYSGQSTMMLIDGLLAWRTRTDS